MKKFLIKSQYKKTLDGKTGRIAFTFPAGFLSRFGVLGNELQKNLLENTLPSQKTVELALGCLLGDDLHAPGVVYFKRRIPSVPGGFVYELQELENIPAKAAAIKSAEDHRASRCRLCRESSTCDEGARVFCTVEDAPAEAVENCPRGLSTPILMIECPPCQPFARKADKSYVVTPAAGGASNIRVDNARDLALALSGLNAGKSYNHQLAASIIGHHKHAAKYLKNIATLVNKEYLAGTIRKKAGDKILSEILELRDDLGGIKLLAEELHKDLLK